MCGICGIAWEDRALIARMTERLRHRGPDGEGTNVGSSVSLGHRRLAIIGLTEKGLQPMEKDGLRITYNGEVYNYAAVQRKLAGHRFTTGTDTEVLLAAYREWGPDMLPRLNGMFAFCIHDAAKDELFLARDRFGIKPLYYAHTPNGFAFASEIGALGEALAAREVDPDGLRQFFTFRFTLGETTMVKGVRKLLPGHWLKVDLKTGELTLKRWYRLRAARTGAKPYAWWRDELRRRLEKAVERRMVADVPVSAFLSGGVDSSAITLLAKRHNPDLNTFSMGFDTTDERPYARLVAERVGTNHHETVLDRKGAPAHLDAMVRHMDEPIGDPGFLPIYLLSREVARKNKVVLSGDGGDEVLAGYDRYKLLHYGWGLRHAAVAGFGSDILGRLRAMRGKDAYGAFLEIIRLFDDEELTRLGVEPWDARREWDAGIGATRVERAQSFDIDTLLPNDFFMKADKMSSAWGLEQRVPFLDHELVELCFAMPLKHKLRFWNEKRALKDAFPDLPREITRRRKHGFNVPIDHWFRGALGTRLRALLAREHGLYDKRPVRELLARLRRKGTNYTENFVTAQKLWSVLVFELWYWRELKGVDA